MYKTQLLKLLLCPIFVLLSVWAMAQGVTVSGKITDDKGQPLPGATVIIRGTTKGTNADLSGKYTITANNGNVLIFSMLGYIRQEVKVAGTAVVNITLVETPQSLNEVVVIGYGTQKRKDLTGSVASVKGDSFKDQPISDPISALQGRVAGINVIENSSQPGATPTITIRGLESLSQPAPLYIVDGVRVPDITNINVQDIASI
ncbi:MAG TPA: carboxypeptidase-like regulatory domain-containing protein, partial [Mucilaginibacter sp.]|nr:carboxypeptidase-like regulatory domain-containing protein [Mucilaginibacter sp.]